MDANVVGASSLHTSKGHSAGAENRAAGIEAYSPEKRLPPTLAGDSSLSEGISAARTVEQKRVLSSLQKKVLSCYLQIPTMIDNVEELEYLLKQKVTDKHWILNHVDQACLTHFLTPAFIQKHGLMPEDIPEAILTERLVLKCLKAGAFRFYELPEAMKSKRFAQICLHCKVPNLLESLKDRDTLNIDYSAIVASDYSQLEYVPPEYQTFEMCRTAINAWPYSIRWVSPRLPEYKALIDQLRMSGMEDQELYQNIAADFVTEEMVKEAEQEEPLSLYSVPEKYLTVERCKRSILHEVNNASYIPSRFLKQNPELLEYCLQHPNAMSFLPDELKTDDVCIRCLSNSALYLEKMPLGFLHSHPEWIMTVLRNKGVALEDLPKSLRTFERCQCAMNEDIRSVEFVPEEVLRQHPELVKQAARKGKLNFIPESLHTLDIAYQGVMANPDNFKCLSEDLKKQLPHDLLLAVAPEYLPLDLRRKLVAQGDTSLDKCSQTPLEPSYLSDEALLEPLPPISVRGFSFEPAQFLKKRLMACSDFKFRNKQLGSRLKAHIKKHEEKTVHLHQQNSLPKMDSFPKHVKRYGGRTCMSTYGGRCHRFKFLRCNEKLDDFFREEAVHQFALEHQDKLPLKSEKPMPVGIKLVAEDTIPKSLLASFRSAEFPPAVQRIGRKNYFVVYEFTTKDEKYSTLAHQPDKSGRYEEAEAALLKTCHDLGVWSSLGAIHTSTIKAYHSFRSLFREARRELFLIHMFYKEQAFPGALRSYRNLAINESDWSYTGLKDWGDMEFYPEIRSYFESEDLKGVLPPDSEQRCAFINGCCENIIAAVLHYSNLHRGDPNYHYKSQEGLRKLEQFLEQACNEYFSGLLGRKVEVSEFFRNEDTYKQWISKMAQETIMWTEPQTLSKDCFAKHLNEHQSYPPEVYPNATKRSERYPVDFKRDHQDDDLGLSSGQFGLTLLTRGLYQISANVASELSQSKVPVRHEQKYSTVV